MLRNTFIHLPHIGRSTERRLWENDVLSWQDILQTRNEFTKRFEHIKHLLTLSEHKLRSGEVRFFTDRLPTDQHWRIYPDFIAETAFIDIETTGLGGPGDHITTIALYNGRKLYYYVHGLNLEKFKDDIYRYKVLVTYNGKTFDIPFIEREFGIILPQAQLDLRYILRSLGLTGGLKSCERQLGFSRGELEGIDGYFAVHLWKDYLNGNKKALETLLAYNIEDTVNLEQLLYYAFKRKIQELDVPMKKFEYKLDSDYLNKNIKIPFKPDHNTIQKIKKKYY